MLTSQLTIVDRMQDLSEILTVGDHKLYLTGYMRDRTVPEDMAVLSLLSDPPVLIQSRHNKWIRIDDEEDEDIRSTFESCHEFIDNHLKSRSVVVHCAAGISRSATVVISYIMRTMKYSYLEAYNYVEERRRIISPNDGFISQLSDYELHLIVIRSLSM